MEKVLREALIIKYEGVFIVSFIIHFYFLMENYFFTSVTITYNFIIHFYYPLFSYVMFIINISFITDIYFNTFIILKSSFI